MREGVAVKESFAASNNRIKVLPMCQIEH